MTDGWDGPAINTRMGTKMTKLKTSDCDDQTIRELNASELETVAGGAQPEGIEGNKLSRFSTTDTKKIAA
jgi:hypothetical protein